jgi:lysophospholipase L1-like esterase
MSIPVIVIYEVLYGIFFYGLILSQRSTLHLFFPDVTLPLRIFAMTILFLGFFVPYFLKLLRIKVALKHYLVFTACLFILYIFCSNYYYSKNILRKKFHSFLNPAPTPQDVAVPKPNNVYRIICLGGSTTAGNGPNNYPLKLQKMIHEKYPNKNIEVVNAGKPFYNTEHIIIQYLFNLKEMNPDLILMCEAINDMFVSFTMPPFSSKPYRDDYGHYYGFLGTLHYQKSFEEFLGGFFFADLRQPKLESVYFNDFKSRDSFRRNLETIIEIAKCSGTALIVSTQAHCYSRNNDSDDAVLCFSDSYLINDKQYADEKSYYDAMELFNGIIRETAEKYSVPFIDQYPAFKGKRTLFTDSVHMTEEGHELKAKLFFDKIVALKLIENKYAGSDKAALP